MIEFTGSPDNVAKLDAALAEARKKFLPVSKGTSGQIGNQKFKYTPLAELTEATTPFLLEKEVHVMQFLCSSPIEGKHRLTTRVAGHGASITSHWDFEPASDLKELGKQTTYLRRYAYNALFILDGEKDADADPNYGRPESGGRGEREYGNSSSRQASESKPINGNGNGSASVATEKLSPELRDKLIDAFSSKGFTDAAKRAAKCRELIGKAPGDLSMAEGKKLLTLVCELADP
jgi:hypothetical protein